MRTQNIGFSAMLVKSRKPIQQECFNYMPAHVKDGFRKSGQDLKQFPENDKLYMKFMLNPYTLAFNTVSFIIIKEGQTIPVEIDENNPNVRTMSVEALTAKPNSEAVEEHINKIYEDLSDKS